MKRYVDINNSVSEFIQNNKPRFIWDVGAEALIFMYKLQYPNGEYMWKPDLSGRGVSKFSGIPINKIDKSGLIIELVCYFKDKKLYSKKFNLQDFQ